jgi:molybdopterin-synthase adenylyltransferase
MAIEATTPRLRARPAQVIESADGVRVRRGCVEIRISGHGAAEILRKLLGIASGDGATAEELCTAFPASDEPAVRDLIPELEQRGLLSRVDETAAEPAEAEGPLEIFYWSFGERRATADARLASQRITVVGVNEVARHLLSSLAAAGFLGVDLVDDPELRHMPPPAVGRDPAAESWGGYRPVPRSAWGPAEVRCIVATSDFGGASQLREWNGFCLAHGSHFLPVVLQDMVGYIGPLVVPGETACFECLTSRWNSNLGGMESRWEVLDAGARSVVGFHPAMAIALGAIAALELTKFYGLGLPSGVVGRLIEVNLITTQMQARKVLRIPRCSACSALNIRSSVSLTRSWFGFNEEP